MSTQIHSAITGDTLNTLVTEVSRCAHILGRIEDRLALNAQGSNAPAPSYAPGDYTGDGHIAPQHAREGTQEAAGDANSTRVPVDTTGTVNAPQERGKDRRWEQDGEGVWHLKSLDSARCERFSRPSGTSIGAAAGNPAETLHVSNEGSAA